MEPQNHTGRADALFDAIADAIPCGLAVFDRDNRATVVNRHFERTLGLPEGSVLGRRGADLLGCCLAGEVRRDGNRCETCDGRGMVVEALAGRRTGRLRTTMPLSVDGCLENIDLLVSGVPLVVSGQHFHVVFVADLGRVGAISHRAAAGPGLHGMVGAHPRMLELFEAVRSVGPTTAPVLILGESGTGKELVAMALHRESPRAANLMVPVNCGALAEGLLESEIFGHVKGAFTGAVRDKKGRFELADGGTIFLDEVGELSPSMQVRLLRVLQNGTFERVGGEQTVRVDVRVICATNRDLGAEVARGRFRADLFYRLSVFPIAVPPLRERAEDIPLLATHLLALAAADSQQPCPGLTAGALRVLREHRWPGNVRELENALRYAVIRSAGSPIRPEHLPRSVTAAGAASHNGGSRRGKLHAEAVREALAAAAGNKVLAARILGVGRATLYRFLAANHDGHQT